jgi:glycosyltransferase involved in cell wall biosynthesis
MNQAEVLSPTIGSLPTQPLAPIAWDKDITFFVACYNEEDNIVGTLNELTAALEELHCTWEIIVNDDGSTDKTLEVVRNYIGEHPDLPIYCHVNERNKGLAQSYIDGAFYGRGKYYRLVCGDNVEPKETFVAILNHLGEADIIIPYHAEARGKAWYRKMLSGTFTRIVNLLSGHRLKYYNGLAVHLRYNVMRYHTDAQGFGFQADLTTRLLDQGFSYVEVPTINQERTKGNSKALTLRNFLSVTHTLFEIFIRRLGRRKRQRQ